MSDDVVDPTTATKLVLEEWKTVIDTQMHFNDMIIRMRTAGVSVVIAVYGAAALALGQYPNRFLKVAGVPFHVSAPIIVFGLLLLGSIFVLDYCYYFRLLIGAVLRGEEIDNAYRDRRIDGHRLFGMTVLISQQVLRRRAIVTLYLFYACPAIAGLVSLVYLLWAYVPEQGIAL